MLQLACGSMRPITEIGLQVIAYGASPRESEIGVSQDRFFEIQWVDVPIPLSDSIY